MEAVFGCPEFKAIPFHEIDEVSYIHQMINYALPFL